MKSIDNFGEILTPEEVGNILKLSPEETIKLLESGDIPGVKVGPIWRVLKASLLDLLQLPTTPSQIDTLHSATGDEIKIGELVRNTMTELFDTNRLPANEIGNLKSLDYSKRVFGLNFPFLKDYLSEHDLNAQRMVKARDKEYPRYWKIVFDGKYLITSEWNTRHRQRFIEWARQFQ